MGDGHRLVRTSSLHRLDAGRLEAGELELHAALELVEQLLQQPVGETQENQTDGVRPEQRSCSA